jgi:hypothetical protein
MSSMKISNKPRKDKIDEKEVLSVEEEINFETKIDDLGDDKDVSEKDSKIDSESLNDDTFEQIELDEIIREGNIIFKKTVKDDQFL